MGGGGLRPWGRGVSGNPDGRRGAVKRAPRAPGEAKPGAIAVLIALMNDRPEESGARIVAAMAVLDRGLGRATAGLPTEDRTAGNVDLSHLIAEQRRQMAEAMASIRKLAFGEHKIK